jgi:hypothetical protein
VALPESTDLCAECECRWQRRRPARAVRLETGDELPATAEPFTPADLAEIRARLSAEPELPEAVR